MRDLVCVGLIALCVSGCAVSAPGSGAFRPNDAVGMARTTGVPSPTASSTPFSLPAQQSSPVPTSTVVVAPMPTSSLVPTQPPPPQLVASYPVDGDAAFITTRPIVLIFDIAMDAHSVAEQMTISPTMPSQLLWQGPSRVSIVPEPEWESGTYEVTLAKGALSTSGGALGEDIRLTFSAQGRGVPIPVLMYHRITELDTQASASQRQWTVSPSAFAQQMTYLNEHDWCTIQPMELSRYFLEGEPLPPKSVIITMDDGYKDVADYALPVLEGSGLYPIVFVIPAHVGYGAYLTWEQLAQLVEMGFGIGAHGYDHTKLRGAADEDLVIQTDGARQEIYDRLGVTVDAFCYPYGSYDEDTIEAVAKAGFTTGFSLNPTRYQSLETSYHLGRLAVTYDMTLAEFADLLE